MSLKARLKEFIKTLPIGEGAFEKEVGLSNGLISNIGKSIHTETLVKIITQYPNLNINWLLTGKGQMLLGEQVTDEVDINFLHADVIKLNMIVRAVLQTFVQMGEETNWKSKKEIQQLIARKTKNNPGDNFSGLLFESEEPAQPDTS